MQRAIALLKKIILFICLGWVTFAAELEFCLVSLEDGDPVNEAHSPHSPAGDLVPANTAFLEWWKQLFPHLSAHVSTEMCQPTIEVDTGKLKTPHEMWEMIAALREAAIVVTEKMGVGFIGGGTHPFKSGDQILTLKKAIYDRQFQIFGPVLKKSVFTFGMHVHVSTSILTYLEAYLSNFNPERWVWVRFVKKVVSVAKERHNRKVVNLMRVFVPHLIAISENAPFGEGKLAGVRDYRQTLTCYAGPMTGDPEPMTNKEFKEFKEELRSAELLDERDKLWNSMLDHPQYKTVEVRVTPTPLSWAFAAHLTLIIAALTTKVSKASQWVIKLPGGGRFDLRKAEKMPNWLLFPRKMRVLQAGPKARLRHDPFTGASDILVEDSIRTLFAWFRADKVLMSRFELEASLRFFEGILRDGTQVDQQLSRFQEYGGDEEALRLLITQFLVPEAKRPL